jgi:hypothetical protein
VREHVASADLPASSSGSPAGVFVRQGSTAPAGPPLPEGEDAA